MVASASKSSRMWPGVCRAIERRPLTIGRSIDFVRGPHVARQIEPPSRRSIAARQAAKRNRDLRHPAFVRDARRASPDRIPRLVEARAVLRNQDVANRTAGADLEEVGGATVLERIQENLDPIIRIEFRIAGALRGADARRRGVVAPQPDVEIVAP